MQQKNKNAASPAVQTPSTPTQKKVEKRREKGFLFGFENDFSINIFIYLIIFI